jgi:hypothetical protein
MLPIMADNSNRWERIVDKPGDKPAFSARQKTDSFRRPEATRARKSRRQTKHGRSARLWWAIGVVVLTALAGILAWQLFAA